MDDTQRILIVEDEAPIREMVVFNLSRAGFEVAEAVNCEEARAKVVDWKPDLAIIDWMLPDGSGLELTRSMKRDSLTREIGIIMLTARADEHDKISGLEGGADDYVTKPFSHRELVARINAVLRRSESDRKDTITAGKLVLEPESHRIIAAGEEIVLGPKEYRLLKYFMTHVDRVLSRAQLLDRVWGTNVYVEERTVDVHVVRLRKAMSHSGCDGYIKTVRGAGYRFSPLD